MEVRLVEATTDNETYSLSSLMFFFVFFFPRAFEMIENSGGVQSNPLYVAWSTISN